MNIYPYMLLYVVYRIQIKKKKKVLTLIDTHTHTAPKPRVRAYCLECVEITYSRARLRWAACRHAYVRVQQIR